MIENVSNDNSDAHLCTTVMGICECALKCPVNNTVHLIVWWSWCMNETLSQNTLSPLCRRETQDHKGCHPGNKNDTDGLTEVQQQRP